MIATAANPQIDSFLDGLIARLYGMAFDPRSRTERIGMMRLVDDPLMIEAITKDPGSYRKNFAFLAAMGSSRFNTDGEEWKVRRDLTQPGYNEAAKAQSTPQIRETFERRLAQVEDPTIDAISRELYSAALETLFRAFGHPLKPEGMLPLFEAARAIMKSLQFLSWVADPGGRQDALDEVEAFFAELKRVAAEEPALQSVIRHMQNHAGALEGFSALEEFVMNFLGGVETSVGSMLWAIDRIADNQAVQDRILAGVLTGEEKPPHLEYFINETLRFFPVIPFVIREVAQETTLMGERLPKGEVLFLSLIGVHQNRQYWNKPEAFQATRREFVEDTYDRRAFIPFLMGQRMCGGSRLARIEIREALKAFLRRFKVERKNDVVKFSYALALRPDAWDQVRIERR